MKILNRKTCSCLSYLCNINEFSTNLFNSELKSKLSDLICQSEDVLCKTESEKHVIECFRISNGLQIKLIHNPTFFKSSVYLTVKCGEINSPDSVSGLAHLLEHLIFQGVEPNKNQLLTLVQSLYGEYQAMTKHESMDFYFQVPHTSLKESCDLFLASLVRTGFSNKSCIREVKMINEEFQKQVSNEANRLSSLYALSLDESLPGYKFLCGNKHTLENTKIDILLEEFYLKYFTADRMCLVIASSLSLIELKEITKNFSLISSAFNLESLNKTSKCNIKTGHNLLSFEINLYKREFSGTIVRYEPTEDNQDMHVYITIPVFGGVNHILTYLKAYFAAVKDKSIYSQLTKANLIKELMFSGNEFDRYTSIQIFIKLTEYGFRNINQVIQILQINLHLHGYSKQISEQIKLLRLEGIKVANDDLETVFYYSQRYHDLPQFNTKVFKYTLSNILQFISNINNWVVFLADKHSTNNIITPYFSINYSTPEKINLSTDSLNITKDVKQSKNIKMKWNPAFTDFKGKSVSINNVIESAYFEHEKLLNGDFLLLKECFLHSRNVIVMIRFCSDSFSLTAANLFIIAKYTPEILRKINAKSSWHVKIDVLMHFSITFECLKHDLIDFVMNFWSTLKTVILNKEQLESLRKIAKKELETSLLTNDDYETFPNTIKHVIFDIPTKQEILENIYQAEFKFISNYYTQIVATGNIDKEDVLKIYEIIKCDEVATLNKNKEELKNEYTAKSYDKNMKCVAVGYEVKNIGKCKISNFVTSLLLKAMLSGPFYNFVRLENPVAYSNSLYCINQAGKHFIFFALQSTEQLDKLKLLLIEFATKCIELLKQVKNFKQIKDALCADLNKNISTYHELHNHALLLYDTGIFDKKYVLNMPNLIQSLTIEDCIKAIFYSQIIFINTE